MNENKLKKEATNSDDKHMKICVSIVMILVLVFIYEWIREIKTNTKNLAAVRLYVEAL